jgi:hypothetical protein
MTQRIRRIDPLSAARIAAVLYGLMGLVFIPFVLVMRSFVPTDQAMPGFVLTLIGAALYNVVAGLVGGLEIELQ